MPRQTLKRSPWALGPGGDCVTCCVLKNPKDPAVLKTLRDSELLHRGVFTTPPIFATVWTLPWEENVCSSQENVVRTRCTAIANHYAIANLLRRVNWLGHSIFSTAGSFGKAELEQDAADFSAYFVHIFAWLRNSEKLKKAVAVSEKNSRSVPEGEADFPAAIFLAGKCPNLGRESILCCWKTGEEFSSSVEICRKTFRGN